MRITLDKLRPNPWNCNYLTSEERVKLREQMRLNGAEKTSPIMARRAGEMYEIVDGEQRWRVAKELGWEYLNAVLVEAPDDEVKALSISYNYLRGRVNWLKLCEVIHDDLSRGVNLKQRYGGIVSEENVDKILSLRRLGGEARTFLENALLKGHPLTLEHLYLLSRIPPEFQTDTALVAVKGEASVPELRQLIERSVTPHVSKPPAQPGPRKPSAQAKQPEKPQLSASEAAQPGSRPEGPAKAIEPAFEGATPHASFLSPPALEAGRKAQPGKLVEETDEAHVLFTCDCGVKYRVDYETRTVERAEQSGNLTVFEAEETVSEVLRTKCPRCGAEATLNVEDGQVVWQLGT